MTAGGAGPGVPPRAAGRPCLANAVALIALCALAVAPAGAEEGWSARTGRLYLHLNVDLLRDLGIEVTVTGAEVADAEQVLLEPPCWSFPILPGSDLRFRSEADVVTSRRSDGGTLRLAGAIALRDPTSRRETLLDGLEIVAPPSAAGAPAPLVLRSASGLVLCELRNSMFDFRRRPALEVHYLNAHLAREWAEAIGRPELAGWVIGLGELRAGAERLWEAPGSGAARAPVRSGGLLDVALGRLEGIQQVARSGTYPNGRVALSMATTSCNLGTVDVPWLAPMEKDHPLIHMALYRLLDGRFEQIGLSWMKHGFFALSDNDCTPCQNPSNGDYLGVGCSDTYDVGNNSTRGYLGPRSEVDAFQRTWECLGSHFSGGIADCVRRHGTSGHGPLDHRLTAADSALARPGATYWYEAYYLVAADEQPENNWGHRRCTMSWNGSAWVFTTPPGEPLIEGPALGAWGPVPTVVDVAPGDGQVLLSVQTTDLGGGTWRYEYALLNRDSQRRIRSFRLPVLGVPNLTAIGFHDGDGDPATDWQVAVDGDSIVWRTASFAADPAAPALRFGALVNFRFEADAPPAALEARLRLFAPGPGDEVGAATSGPANAVAAAGAAGAARPEWLEVRPNPTRRGVTLRYRAPAGPVELGIFDAAGRQVRRLPAGVAEAGGGAVTWDGAGPDGARARAGVYYARLRAAGVTVARPIVLVD